MTDDPNRKRGLKMTDDPNWKKRAKQFGTMGQWMSKKFASNDMPTYRRDARFDYQSLFDLAVPEDVKDYWQDFADAKTFLAQQVCEHTQGSLLQQEYETDVRAFRTYTLAAIADLKELWAMSDHYWRMAMGLFWSHVSNRLYVQIGGTILYASEERDKEWSMATAKLQAQFMMPTILYANKHGLVAPDITPEIITKSINEYYDLNGRTVGDSLKDSCDEMINNFLTYVREYA